MYIYIAGEPGDGFIILLTVTPAVYPRLALKHEVPLLPVELKENVTYLTLGKPKGPLKKFQPIWFSLLLTYM